MVLYGRSIQRTLMMYGLRSGRLQDTATHRESQGEDGVSGSPYRASGYPYPHQHPMLLHSNPGPGAGGSVVKQEPSDTSFINNHFSPYFTPDPSLAQGSGTFGNLRLQEEHTHNQTTQFREVGGRDCGLEDVEDIVDFDAGYVISSKLSQLVASGAYSYPTAPTTTPPVNYYSLNSVHIKPDPDAPINHPTILNHTHSYSTNSHTDIQPPGLVRIKSEPSTSNYHCSKSSTDTSLSSLQTGCVHHSSNIAPTPLRVKVEPGTETSCVSVKQDPDQPSSSESWEPLLWRVQYQNICQMRTDRTAPVDTHGCFMLAEREVPPQVRRYQVLVSLMLSSQTKDQITGKAMTNLKKHGLTVGNILVTPREDIATMIHAVGFWQKKSEYIKRTTDILANKYNSDIPDTLENLMSLPGVGPKMANLVMDFAWGKVTGIAVDTHVHRISHRLGWMQKQTPTPEATRISLEKWLPMSEWSNLNLMMVGFGQTLCSPQRPKCDECLNRNICPSSTACNDATMGGLAGHFSPDALTTGKKKKKARTPTSKSGTPTKNEPDAQSGVVVTTPSRKKRKTVNRE